MDFTLRAYERILIAIQEAGLPVFRVVDWMKNPPGRGVLLRHDVDRLPGNALKMAVLEAKYGIKSTYYFRKGNQSFRPKIIASIAEMGHEIGYHYEDLSLANNDVDKAFALFSKHLGRLRSIVPVHTVAMHGRPLSGIDNRDLWKDTKFSEFDLLGDAFLSIDYSGMHYFTDTGRSWSPDAANLRDKVEGAEPVDIQTTRELADFIKKSGQKRISICAHPERWNDNLMKWMGYFIFDRIVSTVKQILRYKRARAHEKLL